MHAQRTAVGLFVFLTMILASIVEAHAPVSAAGRASATKKVCHTVKVHGKKKRVCKQVKVTPTPKPRATPTPTLTPPNPLDLTIHPDTARSVTKTITAAGGSLTVRGADGTRYTLTFPKDSLLGSTAITMTPISGVDDLPFSGGLVGAVQLDPEGLELPKPATLLIEPARPVPATEQIAFGFDEGGTDFHLDLQTLDLSQITLPVFHFSGRGVARGTRSEVGPVLRRVPRSLSAQLADAMQDVVIDARIGNMTMTQAGKEAQPILEAYYQRGLLPELNAAISNDTLAESAIQDAIRWESLVQFWLLDGAFQKEKQKIWQDLMPRVLRNAYEMADRRCVANHDVRQALRLSYFSRVGELQGWMHVETDVNAKLAGCLRFDLDMDMSATDDFSSKSGNTTSTSHTTMHVALHGLPIRFQPPVGPLSGEQQLDYTYSQQDLLTTTYSGSCPGTMGLEVHSTGVKLGAPFRATLDLDLTAPPSKKNPLPIHLTVFSGTPKEQISAHEWLNWPCPQGYDDTKTSESVVYITRFPSLAGANCPISPNPDTRTCTIDKWTYLGGEQFAKHTVSHSSSGSSYSTTMVLRHTPVSA